MAGTNGTPVNGGAAEKPVILDIASWAQFNDREIQTGAKLKQNGIYKIELVSARAYYDTEEEKPDQRNKIEIIVKVAEGILEILGQSADQSDEAGGKLYFTRNLDGSNNAKPPEPKVNVVPKILRAFNIDLAKIHTMGGAAGGKGNIGKVVDTLLMKSEPKQKFALVNCKLECYGGNFSSKIDEWLTQAQAETLVKAGKFRYAYDEAAVRKEDRKAASATMLKPGQTAPGAASAVPEAEAASVDAMLDAIQ